MARYKDLEKYSFEYLMDTALSYVDDSLDKRKGSYIYDAIAPAMYKLAEVVLDIGTSIKSSFILFAGGEDLDNLAVLTGLERYKATFGVVKAILEGENGSEVPVQVGMKFSSVDTTPTIIYTVTEKLSATEYLLLPEIEGSEGASYIGELASEQFVAGLAHAAITFIQEPASDIEDDESYRKRILSTVNQAPFGGNIADYDRFVRDIEGVGEVQVYPVWDGGGTIKISILGSDYRRVDNNKIVEVQAIVDPGISGLGMGTAPVGHKVTVGTATDKIVNVSAVLTLQLGLTIGQVQTSIEENLEEYFEDLRHAWGEEDMLQGYNADVLRVKILEAMTSVTGVVNVANLTLNGGGTDVALTQTAILQELPILGIVALSV